MLALLLLLAGEPRIDLVCSGGGFSRRTEVDTGYATDNDGNRVQGQIERGVSEAYDAQVDLWVDGGSGEIRLPRSLLPKFRGGRNGWFRLDKLQMDDREIAAQVAVNFANKPRLLIDRQSGRISIDGKNGRYSGECRKRDPGEGRRF